MNVEVATVTTITVFITLFSADVAFAEFVIFFSVVNIICFYVEENKRMIWV